MPKDNEEFATTDCVFIIDEIEDIDLPLVEPEVIIEPRTERRVNNPDTVFQKKIEDLTTAVVCSRKDIDDICFIIDQIAAAVGKLTNKVFPKKKKAKKKQPSNPGRPKKTTVNVSKDKPKVVTIAAKKKSTIKKPATVKKATKKVKSKKKK